MRTEKKTARREAAKAKRKELIALSTTARQLVEIEMFPTVNDALRYLYEQNNGAKLGTLKTFKGWKDDGRIVMKGEKAWLFWGTPKTITKAESTEPEPDESDKKTKFFPVVYLFSESQTRPA